MHNYQRKVANLLREVNLHPDGKDASVTVLHDDWCQIYKLGECNCDPDIFVEEVTPENRERILQECVRDLREFRRDTRNKMN